MNLQKMIISGAVALPLLVGMAPAVSAMGDAYTSAQAQKDYRVIVKALPTLLAPETSVPAERDRIASLMAIYVLCGEVEQRAKGATLAKVQDYQKKAGDAIIAAKEHYKSIGGNLETLEEDFRKDFEAGA